MTQRNDTTPPSALYSKDGKTWLLGTPQKDGSLEESNADNPETFAKEDLRITKIVIGTPPTRKAENPAMIELAAGVLEQALALAGNNLTHLYLWGIRNLGEIPPQRSNESTNSWEQTITLENLECLDVRACPDLETLASLPATLKTLVLDGCSKLALTERNANTTFPELRDLSLRGCVTISEGWIRKVLDSAGKLEKLDCSDCTQLREFGDGIPDTLVDIRLDRCPSLKTIAKWPSQLRRVSLRHAKALETVPEFRDSTDYIDLAYARSLTRTF